MSEDTDHGSDPGIDGATHKAVRSVTRALEIMGQFTDGSPRPRTIAEIVEASGLAKTTVIRLLYTLESEGLLASTRRGYVSGPSLWRWARAANQAWELPPQARAVMKALVEQEKETVNLFIRRGSSRICVAQEESPLPLRHVVRIGDQLPLVSGASSKVLLSEVSPETVKGLYAMAHANAPDLDSLLAGLEPVRTHGYAVSHGEREEGISAVGAPVRSPSGEVVAALTFSGPTQRFPADRVTGLAKTLMAAAATLSTLDIDHPLRSIA
jgi:DNA-binding IclR family transcriptional regulator